MSKSKRIPRKPIPWRCPGSWTASQRLARFTKVDPLSGCHIWQRSTKPNGYGQLTFRMQRWMTHRLAWVARHALSVDQYQAAFNQFVGQGYRLSHVSTYSLGGQLRFAAIWEKPFQATWQGRHGIPGAPLCVSAQPATINVASNAQARTTTQHRAWTAPACACVPNNNDNTNNKQQ